MASFLDKALEYLGLKDMDDDEFYEDDFEDEEPVARRPRRSATVEREPKLTADPAPVAQPTLRITGNPLRPVPLEDPVPAAVPRSSTVRPIVPQGMSSSQTVVHIVTPQQFDSAQEIAVAVKSEKCVIVNLLGADKDLTRRLVDFCAGLTMGVDGKLERVTEQVFLLSPRNVTISNDERTRLQDRGFNGL